MSRIARCVRPSSAAHTLCDGVRLSRQPGILTEGWLRISYLVLKKGWAMGKRRQNKGEEERRPSHGNGSRLNTF